MPAPRRYAVTTEAGAVVVATSDELLDAYEQGRPLPVHVVSMNCDCPRCQQALGLRWDEAEEV